MIEVIKLQVGHYKPPYKYEWCSGPLLDKLYSIKIDFANNFDKCIKYITFCIVPFDRVYEPFKCTLHYGGNQIAKLKYTGPIGPNELVTDVVFENVFETEALGDVLLKKIEIIFMDDSEEEIYVDMFMSKINERSV